MCVFIRLYNFCKNMRIIYKVRQYEKQEYFQCETSRISSKCTNQKWAEKRAESVKSAWT